MTVKANKIFRSIVAIIICISMLLLPIPMEKLGINIGNGVVRADVTEADLAAMLGLLDDYALITAGDYNSSWGSHIMGPVAIGGDFYGQGISLANNQSNSYFAPRTYDFVLGGSFVDVNSNPSFVQLNVKYEFYLVASHSGSNFYTNQNETGAGFNTTSGTLSDGTDYYAYDDYGTSEHPLPIDFDKMIEAAKAWSSSFDEYCSDTSNTDVQQIANTGSKLELVGTDSDINYFNIDNTATGSTQLYITVPNASSKIIINTDGYWDVSEYYLMFSDTDTDYSRVYPEQYSASTNDDYERWYIENLVFTSDDSSIDPTALLAGVLIAPNCDASVNSYYCSSWIVNSIEAKYSCFDIYGSSLARFGWNSWIPTTPPAGDKADIEVTLVDDSDPVVDITSLCETDPDTYFVLVDSEGTEVKKATYENGKVVFKGVPVDEDEYSVVQFGYPKDGNGTPYVTVDGGATSINVKVTDKDTYVVTGGLGEADNKVVFQNRLSKYVDLSVKVIDGDTSAGLSNAVVDITADSNNITSFTTGTDGIGVDSNASSTVRLYEKTEYTATESTVPTDYVANPDTFVITVDSEGDLIINNENIDVPSSGLYTLSIKNIKPNYFDIIVSTVDENDEPLDGIDITITNKDDSSINYTLTTDGTGKVVFENIIEGDYEIKQDEDDIPKNHEADLENPKDLSVPHDYDERTVTKFVNRTTPVYVYITVEGSDGTPLEGVPVRIEIDGITDPYIFETDSNGKVTFEGREGYSYTITDDLSRTTHATLYKVTADEAPITGTIAVGSDPISLTLTHKILATNDIVAVTNVNHTPTGGFTVTLYDSTGTTVKAGPEVTGTDGTYTFANMPEGTYIVKVTDRDGYVLQSDRSVTVTYDSTTSSFNNATFNFVEYDGSISGTVTDDATTPNPIQGVTVTLYDSTGTQVGSSVTTDSDGKYIFEDLSVGEYTVEVSEYDDTNHFCVWQCTSTNPEDAEITDSASTVTGVDFVMSMKTVTMTVRVVDTNDNLIVSTAEYHVIVKSTDGAYSEDKTTQTGVVQFDVPVGKTYHISDLAPSGYKESTGDNVTVAKDATSASAKIVHERFQGEVTIQVVSSTSGDTTVLTGSTLVSSADDTFATSSPLTLSDVNGVASVTLTLDSLTTLCIKQTETQDGYIYDSTNAVYYEIMMSGFGTPTLFGWIYQNGNKVPLGGGPLSGSTITIYNSKIEGSISGKVTDDATTPNPIQGVEVTLYDSTGTKVGESVTTNQDGEYTFTNLDIGEYSVKVSDYTDSNSYVWQTTSTNPKDADITATASAVSDVNFTMAKKTVTMTVSVVDGSDNALAKSVDVTVTDGNGFTDTKTTSTGSVTFTVPVGVTYTVSDTTPDGYKPSTSQSVPVAADATSASATLKHSKINTIDYTLVVREGPSEYYSGVQGATVTLVNKDTSEQFGQPVVTGTDGVAVFANLPEGTYIIYETEPAGYHPAGYISTDGIKSGYEITVYPTSVNFKNLMVNRPIEAEITIEVKSSVAGDTNVLTGSTVIGADNYLFNGSSNLSLSDVNGVATNVLTLRAGETYYIKQTGLVSGYEYDSSNYALYMIRVDTEGNVDLRGGIVKSSTTYDFLTKIDGSTITILNTPIVGSISGKVDGKNLISSTVTMSGVTVTLYKGEDPVDTTTTDANGNYIFTDVPVGEYTVKVSDYTDANYYLWYCSTTNPLSAEISATSTSVTNKDFTMNISYVTVEVSLMDYTDPNNPLLIAKSLNYSVSGSLGYSNSRRTSAGGTDSFKLPTGQVYTFSGPSIAGYTYVGNETLDLTATPYGDKVILKYTAINTIDVSGYVKDDEGNPIEGASIEIKPTASVITGTSYGPVTTDANGYYIIEGVLVNSYQITETPVTGYAADANPTRNFTVDASSSNMTFNFTNAKIVGQVVVNVTNSTSGDSTVLTGTTVIYSTDLDPLSGTGVSLGNVSNVASSTISLAPGTYYFKETVPQTGYSYDSSNPLFYGVTVSNDGEVSINQYWHDSNGGYRYDPITGNVMTFSNSKIYGSISGKVTDDATTPNGMEGVTVTLYDSTGAKVGESVKTNSAGEYEFTDLAIGEYSVEVSDFTATDSSLWKCATTNPQDAEITATTPAVTGINFGMSKTLGSITVEVTDSDLTAIEGVTITICDENGDPISSISPISTGTDGKVTFSDLPLGTYKVLETVPSGYKAPSENPVAVTLTASNANGTATFTNAKINVVDVVVTVEDDKETPISGVSVIITDKNDPTKTYTTTSTTDAEGKVTIANVPEGTYVVTEVSTPSGYNAADPKDLEITSTTTNGVVTLTNARITGNVKVNVFNTTSGDSTVLTGTTIIYSTNDSFTNPTTVTLTNDTTAATADINLLPGTYYFKLSAPQDGYVQDYTYVIYFQVTVATNDGKVTISESYNEYGYLYVRSRQITGNVMNFYCSSEMGTINGTVTTDGTTPIANVTIRLTDAMGNVVKTTTTGIDGTYSFSDVRKGTYYVTEIVPDKYQNPASNNVEASITVNNQVVPVNFINAPVTVSGNVTGTDNTPLGSVTVTLTNQYGTPVGTATTDGNGNYSIVGVADGTYTVTISNSDGYLPTDSKSATVSNKTSVSGLDFAPVPTTISGTVTGTDASGNPASFEGLVVTIEDSKGNTRTTAVTSNGTYEFTKVLNETYTVSVEQKDTFKAFPDQTGVVVANNNKTANFTTTPLTVSGTLVDENNQPMAGQKVTVTDTNGAHEVTTQPDGTYSVAGVANGQITIAVTTIDGYVPFTSLTPTVAGTSLTGQNFKAVPSTISGTVTGTDVSGNPANLDGLKVTITDSQGHTQTTTVASGKYEFTKVPNETYTVSVEQKDTYVAFPDETGVVVANNNKTANFTTAPLTVSGTLVDENNQPMAGQKITVTDTNGAHEVTTQPDGTYSVAGVANGDITIAVSNIDGYVAFTNLTPTVAGKSLTGQTFKAVPSTISGTVTGTDVNGNPANLDGLEVTITDSQGHTQTTTVASGKYEFTKVPNETYTVSVEEKDTYVAFDDVTGVVVANNSKSANFTTTPLTVSGTLVDENNQPMAGQTVTITDIYGSHDVTTKTDGTYSYAGVGNGDITIDVSNIDGYVPFAQLTPTLTGKNLTGQNFKGVPTEVSGNVTDTNGNPLENVEVQIVDKNDPTNVIGPVKTDSDGNFITTKVPNGDYDVVVITPDGYKPVGPEEISVKNDSHKGLTFTPAPTEVTGNVTDTDKIPLENVEVQLVDKNDPTNVIGPVKTDSDGDFIVTNIPNGEYDVVVVTPDGYKPVTPIAITVANDDHGPLTFTPDASRVGGNVTDTDDTPLDGVEIQLVDPNDPSNVIDTTTTDSNGNYEFKNVPNGDYKVVVVTPDGYKPVDPKEITVKNNDNLKKDFEPDATRVTGTVTDDEGTGLENVKVNLVDPNDPTNIIDTTTTDSNGNYEFKKVPNGDYKVVVDTPAGHQPATPVPVKVTNNDNKNINLTNNIIEDVYVHITDENGAPIPGVKVTLTDVNDPSNPISGTTNSDGKVVFPDLRVGDYEITETRPDGYHSDDIEKHTVNVSGSGVKFDGSNTPDLDNTLEISNKKISEDITIELTDDNGNPVPGADITLYDDNGNVVDTKKTDANGKVTFTDVPEGEYTIGEKSPAGFDDDPDCPIKVSVKDDGVHFNDDANADPDNKYEIDTAKDYYRTEVTVYVHDERKAPLANATVVIATDSAFKNVIGTKITGSNGLAVFEDMAPGTYYVRESIIPTNFTCEEHTFVLVIGQDGIMTVDGKVVSNNGIYRYARRDLFITIDITNYLITAGAGAKVVDTNGDPIKNATIVITDPDGNVIGTFKTDDLGRIDIDDLPVGKYTITVTELPNGYSGAPFSRTLEVLSDGKVAVDGVTFDGAVLVTFRFTIEKSDKPGAATSTGEESSKFVPCLGTAFILTALFALVLAGKKRKEEQNA